MSQLARWPRRSRFLDAISQLVAEGRRESSGSFSMDVIAAQRKLSNVARLEPGLLLGKLIQAAVAAGATQIRFTVEREAVQAKINFPERARTDQRVQQYLATAVALGQALSPRELFWEAHGERRHFAHKQSTDGWLTTEGYCVFRFLGQAVGFWEGLKSSIFGRQSMHELVHRRAYLCPIPVYLDGARMNAPAEPAAAREGLEAILLASLDVPSSQRMAIPPLCDLQPWRVKIGERQYPGMNSFGGDRKRTFACLEGAFQPEVRHRENPHGLSPVSKGHLRPDGGGMVLCNSTIYGGLVPEINYQWEWTNCVPYLRTWTTPQGQVPHICARRWIRMGTDLPSQLWPVQDGLLLNPIELARLPLGVQVIMPVGDLNLDLDQLNLVKDELFHEFEGQLLAEVTRLKAVHAALLASRS